MKAKLAGEVGHDPATISPSPEHGGGLTSDPPPTKERERWDKPEHEKSFDDPITLSTSFGVLDTTEAQLSRRQEEVPTTATASGTGRTRWFA